MYFLLDACEHPTILRVLYFGMIFKDIIFTIIPIGLVVMLLIDFSKALIAGKEDEQAKSVKLIPKRIIYAVIIFVIPWLVNALMKILESTKLEVVLDYNTCIQNVRDYKGNFEHFDNLLKAEEEAERISNSSNSSNSSNNSSNNDPVAAPDENVDLQSLVSSDNIIRQSDGRWSGHYLCTNKNRVPKIGNDNRTIGSAGCGFCSMTMVLRSFGYKNGNKELTPDVVVDQICDIGYGRNGTASPYDYVALSSSNKYNYNLKTEIDNNRGNWYCANSPRDTLNAMFSKYKQYLKDGKRLIINMPGHYISVLGIRSDNTLYVSDPSRGTPGSIYWRGYDWIGPYDIIPNNYYARDDFINNDILRSNGIYSDGTSTGYGSFEVDLSSYRSSSKAGRYTLETLFYITTYSYTKYSSSNKEFPCWKNVTSFWKE